MHGKVRFAAACAGLLICGTAAHAQVTCAQIWDDWQTMIQSLDQQLTIESEEVSDDAFAIQGMVITMTDAETVITAALDELSCAAQGDGTALLTMSETYPVSIASAPGAAEQFSATVALTQENLRLIAGGQPGATRYDFTADSMGLVLTDVTEAGAPMPVTASALMTAPSGDYTMTTDTEGLTGIASVLRATAIEIAVDADDQEAQSRLVLNATMQNFETTTEGTYGAFAAAADLAQMMAEGFASDFAYSYGPLSYTMTVTDATGPTTIAGSSDGGSLAFALSEAGMGITGGGRNARMALQTAQLPFPEVVLAYAESLVDVRFPVSADEALQDFTATTRLIGVTVSDEIWGLIDPMATLPRDPATVIVDTNGKVRLTSNLMDEAEMAALAGGPPGEIHALNIPALQLTVAGAELTGEGAFTFDNSDLTTFQGMPAPTGRLDLQLVGGNGLLDKLIALGIVPEEQAMGARMMMGMFARPGEGPDTLTSTIEFRDGGLFANGMQLQ